MLLITKRLFRFCYRLIKCVLFVVPLISIAIITYFFFIETPYRPRAISLTTDRFVLPRFIAHKAKSEGYPGNSIEGIAELVSKGIGGIEIDIQLSKDGVPVLFHGLDLAEGTTGQGKVSDVHYSQIEKLNLTKDGQTSPFKVPKLDAVLEKFCNRTILVLDVKSSAILDQSITEAAVALVQKYRCQSSVIFDAINPAILRTVRRLDQSIPVSLSFLEDNTATKEESQDQLNEIPVFLRWRVTQNILRAYILPDYLSPRFSVADDRLRELKDLGYPLIAWTVDSADEARRLFSLGVQSILSNEALTLPSEITAVSVDDASRLNMSAVKKVSLVRSVLEVQEALRYAREHGLQVSIAGKRHSMGGQTIAPDGFVIDMNGMKHISYDEATKLVTVEAGASWKSIQELLDGYNRSVFIMQSDNVFSVGGSLSVNVHGWQPNNPPLASSLRTFRMILADGSEQLCQRPFAQVCRAALGGYGLVGVIVEATFDTVENVVVRHESAYVPIENLAREMKQHTQRPGLELLYARLRVDADDFLREAGVHAYYRNPKGGKSLAQVQPEALVQFKRSVFRLSERSEFGKAWRWRAEKHLFEFIEKYLQSGELTRNQVMYSDFQLLWPADFSRHDILHEYFVPIGRAGEFIANLEDLTKAHAQNLLNVTVRHVRADTDSLLPYANAEVLSFVLLFSQRAGDQAETEMQKYTQALIDSVLALEGAFYLPYRLHFTSEQLRKAYPSVETFRNAKKIADPSQLFRNKLWDRLQ